MREQLDIADKSRLVTRRNHADRKPTVAPALAVVSKPPPAPDIFSGGGSLAAAVALPDATPALRSRILIAEDNPDMREYVERLLFDDYQVESVADGESALALALAHPPDLVLTDIVMPRLDGFALLKALRGNQRTAAVPIILLSSRAGEEARVEGISASADDYLVKPFSERELLARVKNHLALARLRRESKRRVRQSEDRFRALVAATSDVVYSMSPDWREMRQLQGRDFIAGAELPASNWLEKYIHPDDRPMVLAAIDKAICGKCTFELEHRVLGADGSLGWTFSRAVPLLDANGEIVEWFGAASDVTARKQSEQALLRSEKLASLGRMAATIAHEINNPLESVTNLLFLADHTEDLPERVHRYLQMADVELQRVAHIARQSLGFYRESNAPTLTSVTDLLDSALDLLKRKVNEKQAVVEKDWRSNVQITAVAGELRQVFSNLLSNSLDAIDRHGKIKIRVSAFDPSHTGARNGHTPAVRVTLSDDGRGISPTIRSHIFEPFFTTKGTVGTGLGLWVTKQIVDKHGGAIAVRSRSEGACKGTAFSIVLPVQPSPALQAK